MDTDTEVLMAALQALALRGVAYEAVIRALVARHPQPDLVRRDAESVLMQAQSTSSLRFGPGSVSFAEIAAVLDSLFSPPASLPPHSE